MGTGASLSHPWKVNNALLGWSYDLTGASANTSLTAATVFLSRIPIYEASISVTNVIVLVGTAGVTLTNAFAALYKSDGVKIGQSADQSAVFNSTGLKTVALSGGPFTVTPLGANDFVWGCLYVGTAATPPGFARAVNNTAAAFTNAGLSAALSRAASQAVADTSSLPTLTPASNTQTAALFWMGLT